MNVRITSDGTPRGTCVREVDTNAELRGVKSVDFHLPADDVATAVVTLFPAPGSELSAEAVLFDGRAITYGGVSVSAELFRQLADSANQGKAFRLVKAGGIVELERLEDGAGALSPVRLAQ